MAERKVQVRAELSDTLGRKLSEATLGFHSAVAERLGIGATDQKALDFVYRNGEVTVGQLAEHTGHTSAAATGIVDRLEQNGFVRRFPHSDDRRKVVVRPVEARVAEVFSLFDGLTEGIKELVDRYNEKELATVHEFLTGAIEVLQQQTTTLRLHNE